MGTLELLRQPDKMVRGYLEHSFRQAGVPMLIVQKLELRGETDEPLFQSTGSLKSFNSQQLVSTVFIQLVNNTYCNFLSPLAIF